MPKETFFNLPKNKQEAIIDASIKEFGRVSFNEVSINQIIHNAGISRGSFYMYFIDKEDLYHYILKTYREKLSKIFEDIILKNNGDIINTYLNLFDCIMDYIEKEAEEPIFKKMILNVGEKSESIFKYSKPHNKIWNNHIESINYKELNLAKKEDVYDVIEILNALLIYAFIGVLKNKRSRDVSYQKFKNQLFILKNGLYRGGKNDKNI